MSKVERAAQRDRLRQEIEMLDQADRKEKEKVEFDEMEED
jgi:hypothetical protein